MAKLDEIGCRLETWSDGVNRGGDKSSVGQDYLDDYEMIFTGNARMPKRLLEVGVFEGRSLALWAEYFDGCEVWGMDIDINPFKSHYPKMVGAGFFDSGKQPPRVLGGNSTSKSLVQSLELPGFDIIIDDGLHTGDAQRKTFENLFLDHLLPGGLYIVEDTHPNESFSFFSEIAGGMSGFASTPEDYRAFVKSFGRENIGIAIREHHDWRVREVESILFLRRRIVIRRRDWGSR